MADNNREDIRKMVYQWGLDLLEDMEHKHKSEFGNIARTEVRISAVLARELGLPNQELRVVQHWNFKERTPRKYFVFWAVDRDPIEPVLSGNGEFLSE